MLCSTCSILVHDCSIEYRVSGLREAQERFGDGDFVKQMQQIVAISIQTLVPPYCNPENIRGSKDPTKPVPLGAEIHGVEVGRIRCVISSMSTRIQT